MAEATVETATRALVPASVCSIDWQTRCVQERARADAAEARCEELRWAEVDARAQAGSYKGLLDRCREKLEAIRDELKRVCRTAKNALGLEAEVERLQSLLKDAGVDPRKRATVISLRMEVARLTAELGTEQEKTRQLEQQKAALEKEVEALRSTRSVLSKALYGSRSEQQKKPKSDRPRGQQKDKPGHGRTARPDLEKKEERHDPPENARLCSCCGKPYVANGDRASRRSQPGDVGDDRGGHGGGARFQPGSAAGEPGQMPVAAARHGRRRCLLGAGHSLGAGSTRQPRPPVLVKRARSAPGRSAAAPRSVGAVVQGVGAPPPGTGFVTAIDRPVAGVTPVGGGGSCFSSDRGCAAHERQCDRTRCLPRSSGWIRPTTAGSSPWPTWGVRAAAPRSARCCAGACLPDRCGWCIPTRPGAPRQDCGVAGLRGGDHFSPAAVPAGHTRAGVSGEGIAERRHGCRAGYPGTCTWWVRPGRSGRPGSRRGALSGSASRPVGRAA